MKRPIILAIVLLMAHAVFSQPVTKVLIIDTLESPLTTFTTVISSPTRSDLDTYKQYDPFRIRATNILETNINQQYPNLIVQLTSFGTSSGIKLQLDDSGGTMLTSNLFNQPFDTIRISKYMVFHNCFPDTIKYWKGWYRVTPNDTSNRLKLLKTEHIHYEAIVRNCSTTYPDPISVNINGKMFTVPMDQVHEGVSRWYHGHKKMSRRKERKWDAAFSDGKPYVYFAATATRQKLKLSAAITMP